MQILLAVFFSSSARSFEFSFFDACVVAAIVLFLFCPFRGGLRTSSGLFEAGLRHLFGAIVLGCPSCFVELALLWSTASVPVHVSPFSTSLSLFVLLIFMNLSIFCCVNVASTDLLHCPDISHEDIPRIKLVSSVWFSRNPMIALFPQVRSTGSTGSVTQIITHLATIISLFP